MKRVKPSLKGVWTRAGSIFLNKSMMTVNAQKGFGFARRAPVCPQTWVETVVIRRVPCTVRKHPMTSHWTLLGRPRHRRIMFSRNNTRLTKWRLGISPSCSLTSLSHVLKMSSRIPRMLQKYPALEIRAGKYVSGCLVLLLKLVISRDSTQQHSRTDEALDFNYISTHCDIVSGWYRDHLTWKPYTRMK